MNLCRFMSASAGLDSLQKRRIRIGRFLELNDPYDCAPRMINLATGASEEMMMKDLGNRFGILSYSETFDDPVIWSHYADSHRGLAFVFDYDPNDGEIFRVDYKDDRTVLDFSEFIKYNKGTNPSFDVTQFIAKGFTTKAKSWSYEKEYRQFINLDACDMEGDHYFRPFPEEKLQAVILGVRCKLTETDVMRCLKGLKNADDPVVSLARKSPNRYEVITDF